MTKTLTQDAKMLHYLLTTFQKGNQFFFLRDLNDTGKRLNIKLKVFPESYQLCGKPETLYKTNFQALFLKFRKFRRVCAIPGGKYEQRIVHQMQISFRLTTLARFLVRLYVLAS